MKSLTLKNSVNIGGVRKPLHRLSISQLDYQRGLAHGRTGECSSIEQDQSEHYYEGVAAGMREFYWFD